MIDLGFFIEKLKPMLLFKFSNFYFMALQESRNINFKKFSKKSVN